MLWLRGLFWVVVRGEHVNRMSTRTSGFDPNQKRAGDGTWERQSGTRPAGGSLRSSPPSPAAEWPADAWPSEDTSAELDVLPSADNARATARLCVLCDAPVTDTEACPACQPVLDRARAGFSIEQEEVALRAAYAREKLFEAESPEAFEDASQVAEREHAEREHAEYFERQNACALCDQPHHAKGLCQQHYDERRYGRTGLKEGSRTPWGPAQQVDEIAPGIASVHTSGHGGYKLSPERNATIPHALRRASGWYEEDAEWAVVGVTFPDELAKERPALTAEALQQSCDQKLRDWEPTAYEQWKGVTLLPGESLVKDEREWGLMHADDFVGYGATSSETEPGVMRVSARRASDNAEAQFLVPKAEYDAGRADRPGEFGRRRRFVISRTMHRQLPDSVSEPEKVEPNKRLQQAEVSGLLEGTTPAARKRIEKDLRQRWRGSDGRVQSMADLLINDGAHHRTVYASESGRSTYAVVQSDGSSMRISKALFTRLEQIPDSRTDSQRLLEQLRSVERRQDTLRNQPRGTMRDHNERAGQLNRLGEQHAKLQEQFRVARQLEQDADVAVNGTWEQREQARRQADAERERQARITP